MRASHAPGVAVAAVADKARPPPLSLGALGTIVGFHIARAAVGTVTSYERFIGKPFDLRKAEFSLLVLVQANGAVPPKRLARTLAVTAPSLTLLLDRLQERGLLKREPNLRDGRSQNVVLTDAGRKCAADATAASVAMERELHQRLSPAEHAMLIELLGKLAAESVGHPHAAP